MLFRSLACIINAANEVVVKAFLESKIRFLQMSDIIEQTMSKVPFIGQPTVDDYIESDNEARTKAAELLGHIL